MDLTCLYLLESRHYYFSAFQANTENNDDMAHAGFQLRNRKLLRAGEISRQQHQRFLLPLMMNRKYEISRLNGEYKRTSDYIKNTAANVQQQVGRIERARVKSPMLKSILILNWQRPFTLCFIAYLYIEPSSAFCAQSPVTGYFTGT